MLLRYRKLLANEFYRNVFTLISATSVAQGIAFLIYPVLTRLYTREEHGIFSVYMSIIAITTIISTGKYELAVLMPKSDKRAFNLTFLSIFLSLIFSFFLLLLVVIFGRRFSIILGDGALLPWLYLVPVSTILVSVFQSLSVWVNRHKRYGRMAEANVSQSVSNSIIKVSSSGFFPGGGGLIMGAIVGQAAGIVGYLRDIFGKDRQFLSYISKKEIILGLKEYKLFPRFSMLHYLVNNFSTSMPVFALSAFFSTVETGVYSLAFLMVFRPISILTNSFGQVFSQRVVSFFNAGTKVANDVNRFIRRTLQIGIAPFVLAGILAPFLFPVIFGEEWAEAGRYLQVLLPWMFCTYMASPLSFLPDMLGRQKHAMWMDIIKFILRLLAISTGIYFNDIYVMLIGFSLVSTLVTVYAFFWYIRLSRMADKFTAMREPVEPDIFLSNVSDIQQL